MSSKFSTSKEQEVSSNFTNILREYTKVNLYICDAVSPLLNFKRERWFDDLILKPDC